MMFRIIKNDLRVLIADRVLYVVGLFSLGLIAWGLWNGVQWTSERQRLISDYERKIESELQKQREEAIAYETGAKPMPTSTATPPNALMPTNKAVPATLPPTPLSIIAVGQADINPFATSINIMTEKHDLFQKYEIDNPLNLMIGRFDLAFVLVFILPLLILALSYNLLSAEKENGTLALTLASAGISIRRLGCGKLLARFALVLIFIVGFSLIGFALSGIDFRDSNTLAKVGFFILAVASYVLFWMTLALLVNSFGFSSATNAAILGGVWILTVVVFPSFLHVAANTLHPLPSRLEFVSKMREADNQTRSEGERLLKSYYGDHPELLPPGGISQATAQQRFFAIRQERQRRMLPEVENFERQLAAQQLLVSRYQILSPPVVMQEILNDIAGNSTYRYKLYVNQLREFISEMQAVLVPKLMRHEMLKSSDYDAIPRFHFREEEFSSVAFRLTKGILLLLIPTVLILVTAFLQLRKFSPI